MKELLRIKDGNAELINSSAQRVKTFYNKGDCVRVDWYSEKDGSVVIQTKFGKLYIINRDCQIIQIL